MKKESAQTKRIHLTTVFQEPVKLLYLLIPVAAILLLGTWLMGITDALNVLRWSLMLTIFGLAVYPLSARFFGNTGSGGFFLAKPLGIILVGVTVWTLTYMHIFRFNIIFIIVALVLITAICYGKKSWRDNLVEVLSREFTLENIVYEEVLFAVVLTLLCYFKGFLPNINGEEKFMNYGFIMSMIRSERLPANDMWLSGFSINYYYFGQYLYTMVIKLCGIKPAIAYNIAMCSAIAIPFSMCNAIGTMLADTARKAGVKCNNVAVRLTGILCAFTTMIFGNSHSFFYDENSMGNGILKFFGNHGIDVGKTEGFFYPDSTRFIGWNPESTGKAGLMGSDGVLAGDHTIEEFPFYSFLVGDLHAHVVSTMSVLLIMALCVAMISKVITISLTRENSIYLKRGLDNFDKGGIILKEFFKVVVPELILAAFILGCTQMTNYWDFLIYFVFLSMTLLVYNIRQSDCFSNITGALGFIATTGSILGVYLMCGQRPYIHCLMQLLILVLIWFIDVFAPCALSRTALGMSFIFTLSNIVAIPFNSAFDMISNKIAPTIDKTPFFQLFILWGTHFIILIAFIVCVIVFKNRHYITSGKTGGAKSVRSSNSSGSSRGSGKSGKSAGDSGVYGVPSGGFANPVARFVGERNTVDIFAVGMALVGFLMIIAPEFMYVRDIYYMGHMRANTMFKFTYAGFIILSMAMGYAIVRFFWFVNKKGKYSNAAYVIAVISCILMIIPGHYTAVSLKQRCGEIKRENYKGLDGTSYLFDHASRDGITNDDGYYVQGNLIPYLHCIEWFNANVTGTPVIMEMHGWSYSDNNIVSAYTGLQTVMGWHTHEQLWRFHGIVNEETDVLEADPDNDSLKKIIYPREETVRNFYVTTDPLVAQKIIDEYSIEYVVVGDLERGFLVNKCGYSKEDSMTIGSVLPEVGELVFSEDSLKVYRTTPSGDK